MSARGKLASPMVMPNPASSFHRSITEAPRGTRLAAPLSSHRTGAGRRTGGDGDGGTAGWKTTAVTTTSRLTLTARLEKPTIASTLRAASNRSKVLAQKMATPRKQRAPIGGDKKCPDRLALGPISKLGLQQGRKAAGGGMPLKKDVQVDALYEPRLEKQPLLEMGVQTNEAEILNRDLLVGDIKLLLPSPQLAKQIDRARAENKKKLDRQTIRQFSSHEQDEEQHLDELKQFMERSYVTRRMPKKPPMPVLSSYEPTQYNTVFKSMDEFFTRDVPKAESITNIKERIRRKEVELMSMFDEVEVSEKAESESEGD